MNHNPLIANIILAVFALLSIYGCWLKIIKPFFFPKNKEKETIHKSARIQSTLIDRRIKK